ncbi:hypothetical protein [Microbacterium sp. SORGH_AS_0969]|uniref:hypothetical protein n=1 Tax=Microbacterium sp. SORGH_AS_0969 TaxID=3041793 RepID=UPI00278010B9|nr:hypothetical protein [Microbacterium sp. SORGH_AS_0969]MDQ1076210.1 hypothetical protein [Microbacterium sp. SORGH_AS_0969]
MKVWKGVFQYEEEVASDSTGVFRKSGRYDHTFNLPAGEYTFAALIYHQGEDAPRFDRAYDVTVTESASKPELKVTNFTTNPNRLGCVPHMSIEFSYEPDAPMEDWTNPESSRLVVLVLNDAGDVVDQTVVERAARGGTSDTYFLAPGHYTLHFVSPLTGGGTTVVREESFEILDRTIVVPTPQQVGNTVVVPPAPDGAEYFNVTTGETVTGTLDLADTGKLTLDARSLNGCALKYDGPWTYLPNEDTFVILTSGPNQTVHSDGEVTITFNYDLRPDTEREGIAALLDVYIEDAAGERTVVGKQLIGVDGPATFDHSVTLKPGTYTRYITSTYLRHCDCMPIKDIVAPYTFTVPEQVTPTWPIQEGNIIKVVPQPGVIFTDKDGNALTGDVPVPEDGLTVIRTPEQGYAFPEGTDTEKTYEYVPPVPQPTEVTPAFPEQEPGSNVITFTPQQGVIFTDADGNVIDGSFTVTEGNTTITATPAEGYTFPSDASTEQTYVYYAVTPTPTPQPTSSPSPTATVTPTPQPSASASTGTGPGSNGTGNSGSKSPSGSTLATTGSDVSGITAGVAVLLLLAGTGTLMARAARRRS